MMGYVALLAMASTSTDAWLAVAAFSLVAFATDLGTPATWAFMQDAGGRYVGSVLGWGNMWGNLGAAVAVPALGMVVGKEKNWSAAFITCAVAFLISGLAAIMIDATRPIVPDDIVPDDDE